MQSQVLEDFRYPHPHPPSWTLFTCNPMTLFSPTKYQTSICAYFNISDNLYIYIIELFKSP